MRVTSNLPKYIEKVSLIMPFLHFLFISVSLTFFFAKPSLLSFILFLGSVYILPLLVLLIFESLFPLREGISYIGVKEEHGHPWIFVHRLQWVFITFPFFERVLILIPGAFSFWLRLWGSHIGKKVVWTPRVEILDRTHIEVGDYCFIGDKAYISSHLIKRKGGRLMLLLKKVKIGERALIGYGCELGPGSVVASKDMLPALSKGLLGKTQRGYHGA